MVIYVNEKGVVRSIPSSVPQGTVLRSVVVIAPEGAAETLVLKVFPPSQEKIPDISCTPALDVDGNVVCTASIPAAVTKYAGKAEYQIFAYNKEKEVFPSKLGSFTVTRGVLTDMPDTAEELGKYSLAQIYSLLADVREYYNLLSQAIGRLGTLEKLAGTETLLTAKKTLTGAVNELWIEIIRLSKTIDKVSTLERLLGNAALLTESKNLTGAINEILLLTGNDKGFALERGASPKSIQTSDSSIAGIKGYYWTDINLTDKTVTLSRIQKTTDDDLVLKEEDWIGQLITIHNDSKYIDCSKVTAVAGNTLTVDKFPFKSVEKLSNHSHITDGAVFMLAKPDVGECDFGQYSFSVGDNNEAINYAAFSAGRDNRSIGQYAATFGRGNKTGYCGFSAGRENSNLGDHSIVGGQGNTNAEKAYASFLGGKQNVNTAIYSALFGTANNNTGFRSLMLGNNNYNAGENAIVGGYKSNNTSNGGLITGNNNKQSGGNNGTIGMECVNNGAYAFVAGRSNKNYGKAAFLIGGVNGSNTNYGDDSVLCGHGNTNDSSGDGSILFGWSNSNSGSRSVLGGHESTNNSLNSVVCGYDCHNTDSNCSVVIGDTLTNSNSAHTLLTGIKNKAVNAVCSAIAGRDHIAYHAYVSLFGQGHTSTREGQVLFGKYSSPSANTIVAFGDGSASAPRNAFEVLNTGIAKVYGKILASEDYVNSIKSELDDDIANIGDISAGLSKGVSYDNYEAMVDSLNALSSEAYELGNSIYIRTLNVPDLWVSAIANTFVKYTYSDDDTFINLLTNNGYVQVGYYQLSVLETQKVNLSQYAKLPEAGKHTRIPVVKPISDGGYPDYHNLTFGAIARTIMYRGPNGTSKIAMPVEDDDIANKAYVDAGLALKANLSYVNAQFANSVDYVNALLAKKVDLVTTDIGKALKVGETSLSEVDIQHLLLLVGNSFYGPWRFNDTLVSDKGTSIEIIMDFESNGNRYNGIQIECASDGVITVHYCIWFDESEGLLDPQDTVYLRNDISMTEGWIDTAYMQINLGVKGASLEGMGANFIKLNAKRI